MKYSVLIFSALIISFFSFTQIHVETAKVDVNASTIEWKATKVTGNHNGIIKLKTAELSFTDGALSGGSFTIDMPTIESRDLEGENKGKLEGHLKSPDFFAVEEFPTSTFVIKNVYPRGAPGDYKVVGDFTLKGMTKELKFNTMLIDGTAKATITLDRTDYNVKYGSGSFFSNLGDKTIHDNFDLDINLVYTK